MFMQKKRIVWKIRFIRADDGHGELFDVSAHAYKPSTINEELKAANACYDLQGGNWPGIFTRKVLWSRKSAKGYHHVPARQDRKRKGDEATPVFKNEDNFIMFQAVAVLL